MYFITFVALCGIKHKNEYLLEFYFCRICNTFEKNATLIDHLIGPGSAHISIKWHWDCYMCYKSMNAATFLVSSLLHEWWSEVAGKLWWLFLMFPQPRRARTRQIFERRNMTATFYLDPYYNIQHWYCLGKTSFNKTYSPFTEKNHSRRHLLKREFSCLGFIQFSTDFKLTSALFVV